VFHPDRAAAHPRAGLRGADRRAAAEMNDLPNDHDDEPGLGFAPAATQSLVPAAEAQQPYRVLARKYRPSTFADLIGQEPMVRTLANAFDTGRVHQAYILTGVRGVGKTTTARILARAFNYEVPGKVNAPTIHMPELGVHCQAIIDSRHVDVIEMDAASHTGIDDIREIIDNARYRPVMARTKVYIVDEVHMLSKAAFNGLLKTLEEPPEHVKFLFATTEIDKVPITVRSRCQRFDLRRIEADALSAHLAGICAREGVEIEPEALGLIARAAEGSARDALSLLDQAIAHSGAGAAGGRRMQAETVRRMLGLADRGRVIDLFEALMRGDIANALALLKEQYDLGADPAQVLADLGAFVHFVTRVKLTPEAARDPAATPEEARRAQEMAAALAIRVLTRAWQMLLKGLQETREAPRPLAAADMTLVRIAYAADLPSLDDALKLVEQGGGGKSGASRAPSRDSGTRMAGGESTHVAEAPRHTPSALLATDASAPRMEPSAPRLTTGRTPPAMRNAQPTTAAAHAPAPAARVMAVARFEDVVALAETHRDVLLKIALERDVRLVSFERGRIEFALAPGGAPNLHQTLARRLQEWTGERWMAAISQQEGRPTLAETREAARDRTLVENAADPVVQRLLEAFPGAKLTAVRKPHEEASRPALDPEAPPARGDEDVSYLDETVTEDDL
jgi:DNA polymerase-3 subunit gamma/tau